MMATENDVQKALDDAGVAYDASVVLTVLNSAGIVAVKLREPDNVLPGRQAFWTAPWRWPIYTRGSIVCVDTRGMSPAETQEFATDLLSAASHSRRIERTK